MKQYITNMAYLFKNHYNELVHNYEKNIQSSFLSARQCLLQAKTHFKGSIIEGFENNFIPKLLKVLFQLFDIHREILFFQAVDYEHTKPVPFEVDAILLILAPPQNSKIDISHTTGMYKCGTKYYYYDNLYKEIYEIGFNLFEVVFNPAETVYHSNNVFYKKQSFNLPGPLQYYDVLEKEWMDSNVDLDSLWTLDHVYVISEPKTLNFSEIPSILAPSYTLKKQGSRSKRMSRKSKQKSKKIFRK
jgi:hypothetical protein